VKVDREDDRDRAEREAEEAAAREERRARLMAEARKEQEIVWADEKEQTYRVSLVYAGEDAAVVSAVLGNTPMRSLLALCAQMLGPDKEAEIRSAGGEQGEGSGEA